MKKHTLNFGLITLLFAFMSLNSVMAAELLPPQQAIEKASTQLHEKMKDKSFVKDFPQVASFVNQVILPYTDFDKISALVLGKNWNAASPAEKERFKQEFQTLLVRTYSRAFTEFKDWEVRFLPLELPAGETKVMVKTQVLQPGIQPIEVNYRMFLNGSGSWKVYDILIEGVSLVTNYRTTFSTEIEQKGSLNAVIDGLAKRNAEALATNTAKKS
jgi:phospholipid transport system substrate-binding protein